MFKLVVAFALMASALADVRHVLQAPRFAVAPGLPLPAVQGYSLKSDLHPDGSYAYSYDIPNVSKVEEKATVRILGPEQADKSVTGSFSYVSPEGEQVYVNYVADANGFQPQGSHIPPVPAAIQRALDYIAAHPQQQDYYHGRKF